MSNFSFSSFGASRRQRSKSSRRVVSSRQLSYEALELRRLLAREILNDVIDPAKPLYYSDPEEIIVHAGVRLDAGSHKIQLVAPKITILQNAQIGSDQDGSGEVFLTANTSYTEKGTVTAFGMVSIASGAVLRGSTISIVGEHGLKIDTSTGSTQVLATHSLEMESLRGKVELGIGSTIGTNFQGRSPSVTMHSGNSDVVLGSYSKVQTLSGDLEIAADTITLGTHSQLKSFGGKINLRGVRSVSLEDSVGLDSVAANNNSAGAISIASDNRLEYLPIALYDTFALSTRPHTTSSIFLADNVSIIGGDIALDSKAGDQGFLGDPDFLSRSDNPGVFTAERVKSLANILLGVFNDLIPSPISVLVREPTSTITVSSGVQLHAQGDLSVSSQSDAFAISTALWRYLDAKVPFLGGAVGVSYTDASATIDVLGGSELTATNNVDLATYVGNITSASAAVNTEKTKLNIAVGLAIQNSTSKLTVSEGSQIAAGKQVNIDASAKDLKQAQGRSSSFGDLYAGVVVAGVEGTTDVQALIDGQVYAFGTAPAHELIVNPQTQIDYADNAILFEQDVPFRTGDTIYYRTNLGMKLPGLEDGQQVFAILEPANNRKLKLAESRSNAALGKPISFGSAYPTLTNPSGKKVSVFQIDAVDNTLLFEWPDNAPLFSSGQTVTFTAAADRFIGLNDSSGHLVGELASGAYRVEVLPQTTPRAIRLLDANGKVVDLSDNPVFQTESGQLLQVFQFDGDDGTINFNFDPSYPFAPPNQIGPSNPAWELKPGQKLRYIGTLGTRLIGIESKSDYYAIPDRNAPGVIRLASSQRQALSASVSASASAPQIEAVSGSIAGKKSVSIAQVNPAGLLVLNVDPSISSGTQVLYHQSPGLQIEGLVDGRTYYATSVENPEFSSDMPEYYLELRESADPHLPPIYLQKTHILVDELGNRYTIDSIDAATQWLSVGLPSNVTFSGVDSTHLVGKVTHKSLSGDVIQFWNTATEGRFALRVFDPADASRTRTLTTRSLPWNAAAAQVESALREILSTNITVFGVGTSDSPWTILSPGVIFTNPDLSELIGGEIRERSLDANYFTVQAEASSGVFRLELSLSSRVVRSDEIPWNASAEQVRQALAGLGVQSLVNGQGTVENPWVIRCWQESIAESDLLRFQPGWGLGSLGLLSNQNYYAIVAPKELQTRPGSLVLGLSANRPEIPGSNSERLPLFGALDFHSDRESVPTGLYHQLSSRSDGIHIKADLISKDVLRTGIDRRLQKQVAYPEGTSGKQKFLSLIPISSVNLWNLTGKLKTEFETSPVKLQSNEVLFSVSPTYAWMNVSNTVRAVAQQHALLVTSGAIEIKATIDEYLTSKAQATVSAPSKTKLGVAVSVDWVRVSNSVDALIESNAIVTAAMGLSVDSRVNYPWQGQVFLNPNAKDHPGYVGLLAKTAYKVLGGQNGAGAFAGKIGLNDFFLNHYTSAASHSAGNLTSDDAQLPWAIATSFSWIDLQNQTWAQIEDGAQVNTLQSATTPLGKLTIFPTLLQSVDVSAQTNAIQTSFTGNVIANVDVNLASKLIKYKDRLPLLNRDTGTNSGRQALGGAVGTFVFGTDTRAVIGGLRTTVDGGELKAIRRPLLPMNIVAGSGGIAVDAQNNVTIVQATLGSGKGTNFGFSGSAAVVKGSQSNAYAAIEVGNVADTFGGSNPTSKLLIRSVQGGTESKDQGVQVHANDDTQLIPLAGAVFISENKGAGASTSIATLNRDVASLVTGSTLDDAVLTRSKLRRIPLEVTVGDPLDVRANASGLVIPTAIAAAVASGVKPDGQAVEIPGDQVENAAEQAKGVFGVAISGDYTLADVVDNVTAMVDLGVTPSLVGSIVNSTTSDAAIRVHATNSTITTSSAGAAAMVSGNGSSVGLAGAVAMVLHSSDVQAAIRNATLGAYSIDILATNQRRIGSVAAGGSGMRAPNRNAWTANLVGSFAKNDLRTSTQAQVSNIVGLRLGSVTTKAIETDVVWSASGSFQFNLQFDLREDLEENPRDAKPSKSYGFGMAISQQYSDATTVAEIVNSELTTYAGGVLVHANQAAQYYTFAASAAAGSLNVQGEGMFVKVDVDSMTYATIHGGTITIDPDPSVKESDLGVLSSSNPLMITGAGDLVLSTATTTAFAAGVAVAVVSGAIESGATIKGNATIRSKKGNARVTAQSLESLPDPRSASVLENVYTPNRDSTALWTFVVGVVSAKSAKLAADFSVIKQSIESNRSATIEGNCAITLDRGNLIVESIDEADMYSGAGAIANAGGTKDNPNTAAAGAAFNRTSVSMGTLAEIVDSNISVTQDPSSGVAEAVQVYSESKSSVWNFAVGAEVAGNAGIGDSVALSDVNHTVQASVGDINKVYDASTVPSWTLSSVGGVSVVAKDSTELVTTAGQVAIATRGVAGGAAAATSASNNRVQAAVYGYKVTVPVGKLNIDSNSTSTLKTIAIGVSGAGKSGNGWPATFSGVGSGTGNTLIRQVESKIALSEVTVVGAIDIHASDLSDVLSIAGVADFQVNGASKVSVAAGTSAATNEFGSTSDPTKVSYVRSWIEGSSIRSQGGIDIEAVGNQKLKAWTAAGAGRYTNESDQILGFNGAGSGSGNTIQLEVSAIVDESTIVETSSDGKFSMKLMATNEPSILAVSGGVTVAGAKANGSGVKIDIGAAATTNRIDYTTLALIRNKSKILTSGSLTLEAQSSAHVEAVAYGVASSIKKSADGTEWDFTGAGTASLNTIHSTTQASVLQDSQLGEANKQLASVRIAAIDQSSITAGSGGLSSLFSFGETGTFGLSVGVSYSINEVRGKTLASVERAKIYSAGDVDVESEFSARNHGDNIRSISVAGSADLDVGSGILFPLVGAGNKNTVEMQVLAQVADGSIVDSYGELRLNASDTSKLYTNAGGVGLNLIFNKADISGGIAIGAARAQSDFGNTVQSTIDSSQTRSRHATKIHSESLPSIEAVAYGVALSVDVTSMAVSAAGSGASLVQSIDNRIDSLIRDSSVSSQLSDVSIIAIDGPQVDASAGAGDLAITVGNGVALASGVVLLETNTTNQLSASIENPASKSVQSGGDILLRSESKGDYSSLGVAVAAAASIGEFSLPFAGAGGNSKVDLASRVTASIVSGQVQAQESVQVLTTSSDRIAKNTLGAGGLSIGIFGASIGVSLAESHVSNTVTSTISGGAITATSGDIVVDSRASHEMFSESVPTSLSLAIGGAGAGGHAFSTDESQILATIDENPVLNASRGRLIISTGQVEQDGVPIDAAIRAHAGAGVGGLAAIGAVLVKSTDATIRKAEISGNVDLRGVGSLQILAYAAANVIAQSTAVDVGGVAVDVNKSVATVSGTIEASTGNGVYLPAGDVILLARATTSMDVDQSAYTLGLAAAGATISEAYNQRSVSAQLGANTRSDANRDGRLVVQALQEDKSIKIRTVAGTGGFFAGQGATGLLEDKTKTTVSVVSGAVQAGTVSVGAERNKILEIDVDTATISFAIGIGITTATYDDQSVVDVVLGAKSVANNLQLRALDTMTVTSSNRLRRTEDSIQTSGIGGAGLESIQGVMATAKINSESNIIIEDGVRLESGVHPLTRPGGILILPSLQMDYQTHTSIANVGLLLAGSVVNSQTTGKLASSVVIGNHVVIKSRGDLLVGNDAAISSSNQSAGWGGAIFVAGVELDTEIDLDLDQTVTVGQSSSLSAVRNLTISASQDPRTGQPSLIDFRAHAIASSRSLIAAATAKARSTLDENVSLDIGRWTSLESGGNTLLHAGTSKPVFDVLGESSYYYLFGLIRSSDTDNSYQHNPSSNASLQGSVVAGYQNQLNIEVTQDPSNKINSVVSLNPANLYEIPVSPSIQRIGDFNPVDYIKAQQLSSDVSLALQQGVSSTPVPATRIALGSSDFPIIVSGGSVTVVADHVAADSARIEARVASIKVTNHSSDYLLLGSLQIANVPGGAVQFSDSSGKTLSDPVRANISRDTGIPSIKIESDFGTGVGNSSNGPAVFIAKPLVNLGGLVSIHNARGSFGQFAGIVAKEIDISTPNGVFAVDLPNSGWTVAGSPVAQYQNSSEWPLSYSSVILRDANKAAMVGVNSTYQMDLPNWRTATDDAALNDFVYGKPSDPNRDISWVFFGGSVPQDSKTGDGNSQAKSEAWAQLSRIDGDPKALKLTDKTPPLGKNEGWDHAWVPSLQRVAVEGQRPDLASRNPTRMVQGQVVVIRAKTVNINGTIQAGQPKTTDHSIVLPEELETKLLDYQKDYRLGEIGSPILEIPVQWLQVSKDGDELIGATFDARTGQIQLQSVEGSGAGRVHITGKILNTDLAGKIKMTGGSGDITVLNRTKLPLSLSKIQTQSDTKKGVVSITDLNIEDQTQRQVAYVYTGSEILAYRGAEGADLTSSGVLRDRIVGNTTSYQPRSGLRWNWELSAQVQRDIQFDLKNWSGVTASSWRFVPPASNVMNLQNWTVVGGVDSGELSIDSGKSAMTQSMKSSWDAYVYELGLVVHYSKYSWDTGFVKDRNYRYPNHIDLGMTLSIKADYPIGIDFSGLKFGNVSVDSQGTVLVGGSLVSPSVTLISHDGGIQSMQGNIAIDTSKLKLSASDSIGNAVRPFHISADSIELRSDHGSIFVDANRNLVGQPLGVVEAYASQGQVVISANGSIQALNSKMDSVGIQARQVDLVSRGGGIGSDLQPIELQADSDWGNLRLNTRSTGGVSIRVSKGDLLVGLIDASDQEVRIDAQQDIFSGESWTIDPKRDLARLQSLIGVGATDINAYQDDVRDFASRINNDYILYWELRKSGDVNQGVYQLRDSEVPLWRIRAQAIHPDQVLSHDQVRLETRKLYESLVASFSDKMGPDWLSRPEFQKRQDGYQYVATQQQVDRFKEGRFIEAANISIGLLQRALDIPAVDRGLEDRPSIIANRLRLISQAGNIGKQDATMRIAISELNAGRATPEQLQEMNLATRPGDATLDLDNSTLNLNILRPLVISVSGRVDAFANQNVILKNANGPLIAGNIGANLGKVSLVAEEDLLRARRETLDFSGASVRFDQPQNWRLLGTAGQTLTEYSGLFVPGTRNSVSASWFSDPVVHGSFRASFTYHASTADEGSAGDGLAFVLRSSNADEVGNLGGGLGYSGLGGNKAGFLINLYTPNGQKRGTRFDTTGLVGDYHPSDIALVNNTVYVTLIYDATTNTVTSTLGRSVDDPSPEKQTYTGVDLGKLLGDQYYLGFTTATGGAFCSQSVQDFSLVVSDSSRSQQVSFPDYIDDPKWTINRLSNDASDSTRGFAFSQGPSGSTLVFPEKSGIASSTWFGEKVSINSNFYVRFNYDYSSVSSSPADGLALVFHNSSTGLKALGSDGSDLGYGSIAGPKVGLLLNIYQSSSQNIYQGIRFDSLGKPGNYQPISPLPSSIVVSLSYNFSTKLMIVEVLEGVKLIKQFKYDNVDLPTLLGANTAWMGFTAASGALSAKQTVSSFSFYSPPLPPVGDSEVSCYLNGDVRLLANGVLMALPSLNSSTSTWFKQPIATNDFHAEWTYSATDKYGLDYADGMAFVIQDGTAGVGARGSAGGKLGYGGLKGKKVGLLFNIYKSPGIRFDDGSETGDFLPVPWLTGQDVRVQVRYEAKTSSITVHATSGKPNQDFRKTWQGVNLAKLVGLNGLVGFTTGTGASASRQSIKGFQFNQPVSIWALREQDASGVSIQVRSEKGDIGSLAAPIRLQGKFQALAPHGNIYTDPSVVSSTGYLNATLRTYQVGSNQIWVTTATPGATLELFSGTAHLEQLYNPSGAFVGLDNPRLLATQQVAADGTAVFEFIVGEEGTVPQLLQVIEKASRQRRSPVLYAIPPVLGNNLGTAGSVLNEADLLVLASEAKKRWLGIGLTTIEQNRLSTIRFAMKDLGNGRLTQLVGEVLYVNFNAGGNEWFIDPTPSDDSEFNRLRGKFDLYAYKDRVHSQQTDLLSAIVMGLAPVFLTEPTGFIPDYIEKTGSLENGIRRILGSQRINPTNPYDVNRDGVLNPLDALMVVDWLNRQSGNSAPQASVYLDTNFDNIISPLDVLEVIHELNSYYPESPADGESNWDMLSPTQVDEYWSRLREEEFV